MMVSEVAERETHLDGIAAEPELSILEKSLDEFCEFGYSCHNRASGSSALASDRDYRCEWTSRR